MLKYNISEICCKGNICCRQSGGRLSTHISDQLLQERHHASHVVKDVHQPGVDMLDGEGVVVVFLIESRHLQQASTGEKNTSGRCKNTSVK